jgi:hypothetical protein
MHTDPHPTQHPRHHERRPIRRRNSLGSFGQPDFARAALETGCHVILEKPIAATVTEATLNSKRTIAASDESSCTGQTITL